MKATGIVRRIDDLGRVVIPKEIRRTLRIREGEPLEIFTNNDGEVILKKYSPIGELREFASQYAESLSQTTGHIVCIVDKDQIIAVSGTQKKELMAKAVSEELEEAIDSRENISAERSDKKYIHITSDQQDEYSSEIITPIICEGDAIGAVVMLSKDGKIKFGETEQKLAMTAAGFLGRQMES